VNQQIHISEFASGDLTICNEGDSGALDDSYFDSCGAKARKKLK
jgi:hypothetical protein